MKCKECKTKFTPVCPKCGEKNFNYVNPWVAFIIAIFAMAWGIAIFISGMKDQYPIKYNEGYKQGQIDALNNEWSYDRIIQGKLKSDTIYFKIK